MPEPREDLTAGRFSTRRLALLPGDAAFFSTVRTGLVTSPMTGYSRMAVSATGSIAHGGPDSMVASTKTTEVR
jgi:hypothetical protein